MVAGFFEDLSMHYGLVGGASFFSLPVVLRAVCPCAT